MQDSDTLPAPAVLEVSVSDSRSALSSQGTDSSNTNEISAPKQVVFGWDSPNSAASSTGQSTFTFGDDGLRESVHEDDSEVNGDSKTSSQIVEEADLGLVLAHDRPLFDSDLTFEIQSRTSQSGANSPADRLGVEKVGFLVEGRLVKKETAQGHATHMYFPATYRPWTGTALYFAWKANSGRPGSLQRGAPRNRGRVDR